MSMKMTMAEFVGLEPCPFCGGEARIHASHHGDTHYYQVECSNEYDCGAWPAVRVYHTEAEAIAAWNSRAEPTCKQEERGWGTEGDHARVWLTCGHDCMVPTVQDLPNYCPNCGARVVE